jgi:hypothetical protein
MVELTTVMRVCVGMREMMKTDGCRDDGIMTDGCSGMRGMMRCRRLGERTADGCAGLMIFMAPTPPRMHA